jgi:hypothetical protein
MSPVLVNPYLSFGSGGFAGLTEPWGEVARQTSISGGKLTISGLDLSSVLVVRLFITGVAVTTDDSSIKLRFHVGGSEVSSSTYQRTDRRVAAGVDQVGGNSGDDSIPLSSVAATQMVGNAATEAFHSVVTVYDVASTSLYKKSFHRSAYSIPSGDEMTVYGGGALLNTGALTGFTVFGSSNLTAGSVIVLGVA